MDTTITIKTNSALRNEAKKLAEKLGITLTAIINATLRQFVQERKFTVSEYEMPTKRKMALLEKISKEMDEGKNISGTFSDFESLFNHLKI